MDLEVFDRQLANLVALQGLDTEGVNALKLRPDLTELIDFEPSQGDERLVNVGGKSDLFYASIGLVALADFDQDHERLDQSHRREVLALLRAEQFLALVVGDLDDQTSHREVLQIHRQI